MFLLYTSSGEGRVSMLRIALIRNIVPTIAEREAAIPAGLDAYVVKLSGLVLLLLSPLKGP
jgi:hypothetical protein